MNDRQKLIAKHAAELADFDKKETITAAMPTPPTWVHVYALYGATASVKFGRDSIERRYGSMTNHAALDWQDAAQIMEALPPLPMTLVKSRGSKSFRPHGSDYHELAALEEQAQRGVTSIEELTDVSPFDIDVRLTHDNQTEITVRWFTLSAGEVLKIVCHIEPKDKTQLYWQSELEHKHIGRENDYRYTLIDRIVKNTAPMAIRWASGTYGKPGSQTFYWHADEMPNLYAFIDRVGLTDTDTPA